MTTTTQVVLKHRIQTLFFAMAVGLLATGCSTYQEQNRVIQYWHQGNLTNAVAEATKMADQNAKNKDAIIWRLEQGAVLRGNGQYQDSNKAFDLAQEKIDQYAKEAKVKLGHEAGALLSNQANLDYEGRAYDGIMLNTYKALNFIALGESDKARPELIRAYQRQQDAVGGSSFLATVNWLGDARLALGSVLFAFSWLGFPFVMLMLLAGLQGIPVEHKEAARVEGANAFQVFRHITIPFLRPVILTIFALQLIDGINSLTSCSSSRRVDREASRRSSA